MTHLLYVTTEDCHFCEHGRAVLDELHVDRREISVDSSEAEELADSGIPLGFLPVLTDGRRVIAYGRFSEKRLRREDASGHVRFIHHYPRMWIDVNQLLKQLPKVS